MMRAADGNLTDIGRAVVLAGIEAVAMQRPYHGRSVIKWPAQFYLVHMTPNAEMEMDKDPAHSDMDFNLETEGVLPPMKYVMQYTLDCGKNESVDARTIECQSYHHLTNQEYPLDPFDMTNILSVLGFHDEDEYLEHASDLDNWVAVVKGDTGIVDPWVYALGAAGAWQGMLGAAGAWQGMNASTSRQMSTLEFTKEFNLTDAVQDTEIREGEVGSSMYLWEDERDKGVPTSTTKNGYTSYTKPKGKLGKQCPVHDGLVTVFSKTFGGKKISIAGAQGAEVFVDDDLDLVLDLAGMFRRPDASHVGIRSKGVSGGWWGDLPGLVPSIDTIDIKWPDYGIPTVGYRFWAGLWLAIEDMATDPAKNLVNSRIVFCCQGGHGRTGTALAAMYLTQPLNKKKIPTVEQAIALVRNQHCNKAIESDSQIDYLDRIYKTRLKGS